MASFQRVALYILFDSLERDIVQAIKSAVSEGDTVLVPEEHEKALTRLARREEAGYDLGNEFDLLYGLDLGEKYQVLMRHRAGFDEAKRTYYSNIKQAVERSIAIRNHIMHGRQLTINEHVFALDFAQSLLRHRSYWPSLDRAYRQYTDDPTKFMSASVRFLDDPSYSEVLNNLPTPDYDDTGFLPRPELERELKRKLSGRHPVVTVLGEGGNGKTALALRVLYGMVQSHDHDFDAIIWVTAKTSELNIAGVREIESVATRALDLIQEASALEHEGSGPVARLRKLLEDNKILLVVDNYETVIGDEIAELAEDVPGESKLLFTSRKPIGSDLTVLVNELLPADGLVYFHRLVQAYAVERLRRLSKTQIDTLIARLNYKPLLIKWLVLGVQSGLDPDQISLNPDVALRFCLDNVIRTLTPEAQAVIWVLATVPGASTASVIEHISPLNATNVSDGLAQLSRYGLAEVEISEAGEKLYRVKSFARSFIHRLIPPKPEVAEQLMERYRRLEAEFNVERALLRSNPYSFRYFKADTRSRMVIANKLKEAQRFAVEREMELAEQLLLEAKGLDLTFFESHRVEAFISQAQNDFGRALTAFETAISLAPEEPQLYFFTGALLLRMSDNDRAATFLAQALERDPEVAIVHREIARNEMIRGNFDVSQEFVSRCLASPFKSDRDRTISHDLQIQLHVRRAEHQLRIGDHDSVISAVGDLLSFVEGLDPKLFDGLMEAHLFRITHVLRQIARYSEDPVIDGMRSFLADNFEGGGAPSSTGNDDIGIVVGRWSGTLRRVAAGTSFGFLEGNRGDATFVHQKVVAPEVWRWLQDGGAVTFDVESFGGRERACNVAKIASDDEAE